MSDLFSHPDHKGFRWWIIISIASMLFMSGVVSALVALYVWVNVIH